MSGYSVLNVYDLVLQPSLWKILDAHLDRHRFWYLNETAKHGSSHALKHLAILIFHKIIVKLLKVWFQFLPNKCRIFPQGVPVFCKKTHSCHQGGSDWNILHCISWIFISMCNLTCPQCKSWSDNFGGICHIPWEKDLDKNGTSLFNYQ